jgi:hypothetical protein
MSGIFIPTVPMDVDAVKDNLILIPHIGTNTLAFLPYVDSRASAKQTRSLDESISGISSSIRKPSS